MRSKSNNPSANGLGFSSPSPILIGQRQAVVFALLAFLRGCQVPNPKSTTDFRRRQAQPRSPMAPMPRRTRVEGSGTIESAVIERLSYLTSSEVDGRGPGGESVGHCIATSWISAGPVSKADVSEPSKTYPAPRSIHADKVSPERVMRNAP